MKKMSEEIQEDVKITVKETQKESVEDIVFTLNTNDTGKVVYDTETINGVLEAVIIESDSQVQVVITLGNSAITLFDSSNLPIVGSQYLPIRVQSISNKFEGVTQSGEKWALNDSLHCEVTGSKNTTVTFTFRYC